MGAAAVMTPTSALPLPIIDGFQLERDDEIASDGAVDEFTQLPAQSSKQRNSGVDEELFGRWDRRAPVAKQVSGRHRRARSGTPQVAAKPSLWTKRQESPPPAATFQHARRVVKRPA